jgi:hypothetical protein
MYKNLGVISSSSLKIDPEFLFVAAGYNKKCYGTYNGINWREIPIPMTLVGGNIYALGGKISKAIVSPSGSWNQDSWLCTEDFKSFSSHPSVVLVGEGPYIPFQVNGQPQLVGDSFFDWYWSGGYYVFNSSDGKAFSVTQNYTGFFERKPSPRRFLSYENGVYTAILNNGYIATSLDGISWTSLPDSVPLNLNFLGPATYNAKKNLNTVTFVSTDANYPGTWVIDTQSHSVSQQTRNLPLYYSGVTHILKNGTFVTFGQVSGSIAQPLRYSLNGYTWIDTDIVPPNGSGLSSKAAYSGDKIMIASGGKTYTSSDGVSWVVGDGPPLGENLFSFIGTDTYV